IRYFHVTGVQTCALPIYNIPVVSVIIYFHGNNVIQRHCRGSDSVYTCRLFSSSRRLCVSSVDTNCEVLWPKTNERFTVLVSCNRSEERRVGIGGWARREW